MSRAAHREMWTTPSRPPRATGLMSHRCLQELRQAPARQAPCRWCDSLLFPDEDTEGQSGRDTGLRPHSSGDGKAMAGNQTRGAQSPSHSSLGLGGRTWCSTAGTLICRLQGTPEGPTPCQGEASLRADAKTSLEQVLWGAKSGQTQVPLALEGEAWAAQRSGTNL